MPEAKARPQYKRASEFQVGIGDTLDKLADRDVLLVGYEIAQRSMRGESRTFCLLQIVPDADAWDGNPQAVRLHHAWSDSLGEKLEDIPVNQLPVLIRFTRVATSGGFRVWTFE